jgi:hypothetical protein
VARRHASPARSTRTQNELGDRSCLSCPVGTDGQGSTGDCTREAGNTPEPDGENLYAVCAAGKYTNTHTHTHTHTNTHMYIYIICHRASSSVSCTLLYHLLFSNIITLCRSASLYWCARFLVPPIRSTCLRSANLYWCARIETTIVSSSCVSQQFCIGVPLLRLQSYHHQYTSHNHTTILYGRSL